MIAVDADLQGSGDLNLIFGFKDVRSFGNDLLEGKVREVKLSQRLTDSPVCLVVPSNGTPAYLEQLMKERGVQGMPHVKRILEVNPTHPLIDSLRAVHAKTPESEQVTEWIELLFDQAVITEGGRPEDPNLFAKRVTSLLTRALA